MTWLIASFAAGSLITWTITRHHVRNAELRMALLQAWQGFPAEPRDLPFITGK